MKTKVKVWKEIEVVTLEISAGARYWEDSEVNGVQDDNGDLIPFRNGDYWEPKIDLETGTIIDWPKGTTAKIHYKVCDDGTYYLKDKDGITQLMKEGYVPNDLIPGEYGDYIIMDIDENGKILNWYADPSLDEFTNEEDED